MNWIGERQIYILPSVSEGRYMWNIGCLMKTWVNECRSDCSNQGSWLWWNTAVTWVIMSFSTTSAPSFRNAGTRASSKGYWWRSNTLSASWKPLILVWTGWILSPRKRESLSPVVTFLCLCHCKIGLLITGVLKESFVCLHVLSGMITLFDLTATFQPLWT